ncbi:MAG: TrbI/VirB10 family protein, partial [Arenimonas sp.]
VMAAWLLSRATASEDDVSKPREETVVIPELPKDANMGSNPVAAEPIEMVEPTVVLPPQLPPPPAEDYMQANTSEHSQLPPVSREPTLAERRMMNSAGGEGAGGGSGGVANDPYLQSLLATLPANKDRNNNSESADATSAQFINNADSLLVRGTYIRCVLETRIITDIPGFTSCIVTEPVYSINGRRLLLPKGSKISGKYNTEDPKIPRVSVIWDRITTPNGIDVSMASPGVDNLGGAGIPGQYNAHWGSKLSSALLISLVSDAFKYAGEKYGPKTESVTSGGEVITSPFQSNTADAVQDLARQAVARSASRPATVTINQGTIVNVYVAKDVDFSGVVAR